MNALTLFFNTATGSADLLNGRSLQPGDWLKTVIYTSLFTDARASADELPAGETDRQGHWGDLFHSRSPGSLLWTLKRAKLNNDTVLRARDICLSALAWLMPTQLKTVEVHTERLAANRLGILVQATRLGATQPDEFQWEWTTDV